MKFKRILLPIALISAFAGATHAMEKPQAKSYYYHSQPHISDEEFIKCSMVDETTRKILDENFDKATFSQIQLDQMPINIAAELRKFNGGLYSTHILESHNLVVKDISRQGEPDFAGLSRIRGAQLINQCAQENNLCVCAPEKKCYRDAKGLLWIVAQRIKPSAKPFSLIQIKDIYKLAKLTRYQDLHAANVFNTEEEIACIVDTEERSFVDFDISEWAVADIQAKVSTLYMTTQAHEWLSAKLTKIGNKQQTKKTSWCTII